MSDEEVLALLERAFLAGIQEGAQATVERICECHRNDLPPTLRVALRGGRELWGHKMRAETEVLELPEAVRGLMERSQPAPPADDAELRRLRAILALKSAGCLCRCPGVCQEFYDDPSDWCLQCVVTRYLHIIGGRKERRLPLSPELQKAVYGDGDSQSGEP